MTLEERFLEFHERNPHVYARLVSLARAAARRGHRRLGIGMLFEVLRWQTLMRTDAQESFKLNNNHRAFYARLIMQREPDLDGVFDVREQHYRWLREPAHVTADGTLF